MSNTLRISIEFDDIDEASYALMFLDRCGFTEFYDRTEPHLGKAVQTERAYSMRHAVSKIETALREAGVPSRIY